MQMTKPSVHAAIRMSLRANRLKYSSDGDAASIVADSSAPSLPRRPLSRNGIPISAAPMIAYSSREVASESPNTKNSAAFAWN